jgi:hypothetical protein
MQRIFSTFLGLGYVVIQAEQGTGAAQAAKSASAAEGNYPSALQTLGTASQHRLALPLARLPVHSFLAQP